MKPIIGLTGGIGSGKSTVARILESLGAAVIDSDRLSHDQLADPVVVAALCSWWGEGVRSPGGPADRAAIARIVFEDPVELARLEGLIYPRIERRRVELTAGYNKDPAIRAIVLDAPKLFEAGVDAACDFVVFVEADFATRSVRVAASRAWSEAELVRRENNLKPLDKKKADADHVVVNQFGFEDLKSQVERVFSSILASFAAARDAAPPIGNVSVGE